MQRSNELATATLQLGVFQTGALKDTTDRSQDVLQCRNYVQVATTEHRMSG